MTIWKATLRPLDVQEIMAPAGAEMLCAREQHERICVWYRCDPSAPLTQRTFAIVGTGNPSPDSDGRYLGSAMLQGGDLVLHVFERTALLGSST